VPENQTEGQQSDASHAPVSPVPREPRVNADRHDEFARLLEDGIRLRDLWKLVSCFKVATVLTFVGFVGFVFGLGYKAYPLANKTEISIINRETPKHIDISTTLLPNSAQERYPFLVPSIAYLEDEAGSEILAGQWKDSLPVVVVSEPLKNATPQFKVQIKANPNENLGGFAFRMYVLGSSVQYEPLPVTKEHDRSTLVFVPECNQGDKLLFVLRLSAQSTISTKGSDLRDAINLYVRGG